MASSRDWVKGRENLSDGIAVNMLGLRLVMGNVVLSLVSGGGDIITRRLSGRSGVNVGGSKMPLTIPHTQTCLPKLRHPTELVAAIKRFLKIATSHAISSTINMIYSCFKSPYEKGFCNLKYITGCPDMSIYTSFKQVLDSGSKPKTMLAIETLLYIENKCIVYRKMSLSPKLSW